MQHSPPTDNSQYFPDAGPQWKRTIKKLPGVFWLRRLLWRPQWGRIVMNRHCRSLVEKLDPAKLSVLEVSGIEWGVLYNFREYRAVQYPEYDVCESALDEQFDLIIAEQVFEHLLWPYRAGRNVYAMLRPGGYFLISTPFLVKVHRVPFDCSRWTELGLKHLLAECGFPLDSVQTFSWGNRGCVKSNFRHWTKYRPWHSLRNHPDFPIVVWALAQKPALATQGGPTDPTGVDAPGHPA